MQVMCFWFFFEICSIFAYSYTCASQGCVNRCIRCWIKGFLRDRALPYTTMTAYIPVFLRVEKCEEVKISAPIVFYIPNDLGPVIGSSHLRNTNFLGNRNIMWFLHDKTLLLHTPFSPSFYKKNVSTKWIEQWKSSNFSQQPNYLSLFKTLYSTVTVNFYFFSAVIVIVVVIIIVAIVIYIFKNVLTKNLIVLK